MGWVERGEGRSFPIKKFQIKYVDPPLSKGWVSAPFPFEDGMGSATLLSTDRENEETVTLKWRDLEAPLETHHPGVTVEKS